MATNNAPSSPGDHFYSVRTYNAQGQYCGHHALALRAGQKLEDFKDDHDRASPLTESDWNATPGLYQVDFRRE